MAPEVVTHQPGPIPTKTQTGRYIHRLTQTSTADFV